MVLVTFAETKVARRSGTKPRIPAPRLQADPRPYKILYFKQEVGYILLRNPLERKKEEHTMSTAEQIMREIQKLPEPLAKEVLDFIGYIELKHGLKDRLAEELKLPQTPTMNHIWDNSEDEVWNDM